MKSLNTFSILFWINASRAKNNEAEIYARVIQRKVSEDMNILKSKLSESKKSTIRYGKIRNGEITR